MAGIQPHQTIHLGLTERMKMKNDTLEALELLASISSPEELAELPEETLARLQQFAEMHATTEDDKRWGKVRNDEVRTGKPDASLAPGLQQSIHQALQSLDNSQHFTLKSEPGKSANDRKAGHGAIKELRRKRADGEKLTKEEKAQLKRAVSEMSLNNYWGLPDFPEGMGQFQVTSNGIREICDDGEGHFYLCQLFTVIGNGFDPNTGESTLVISYLDTRGNERQLAIPKKIIADRPSALGAFLAANDFKLGPSPKKDKSATRLKLLLELVQPPNVDVVANTGWVQGKNAWGFVRQDMMIGSPNQAGEGENGTRIMVDRSAYGETKIGLKGDADQWRKQVAALTIGNSRLTFALCYALSGPLLRFAPDVETAVVNLVGDTSTGKTTTLRVAGSVWGGDRKSKLGYARSWNATDKALLGRAADHSETLLCLDEFKLATPNVVSAIYDMSSGEERARLQQSGTMRNTRQFRVPILSTGELTLEEKLRSAKRRDQGQVFGGSNVRFLDIPACPESGYGIFETLEFGSHRRGTHRKFKSGAELSEHLKEMSSRHYGHAAVEFVEHLIDCLEGVNGDAEDAFCDIISEDIGYFVDWLELPEDAAEEVRRVAKGFALISVAGNMARAAHIIPHSEDDIDEAVKTCFEDYIAERGGYGKKTGMSALVLLRDFLQKNRNRFARVSSGNVEGLDRINDLAGYYREGTGKRNDEQSWFFFLPSVWTDEIEVMAPRSNLCQRLLDSDLLQRSENSANCGTFQDRIRVNGDRLRVYKVSAKIMELNDKGELDDSDTDEERADLNAGGKTVGGNEAGSLDATVAEIAARMQEKAESEANIVDFAENAARQLKGKRGKQS